MKARRGLVHHEDFSSFGLLLSLLRVKDDVSPISDEPAVPPAASRRSDKHYTCRASLLCGAWCDSEALKTERTTSCSTCTGTVSLVCEYACVNASCCES